MTTPRRRRRPARRRHHHAAKPRAIAGLGMLAVVAWLSWQAARHWYITVPAAALIVLIYASAHARRARAAAARLAVLRFTLAQLDTMDPTAFEHATRDLLARDGYRGRVVGGAGDNAADVIAEGPAGRIVVQCKHTVVGRNIGAQVMQQVNGTAWDEHHADIAIVVTNGGFTAPARDFAARHRLTLIDRAALAAWAEHGRPVTAFIGAARPRAKR